MFLDDKIISRLKDQKGVGLMVLDKDQQIIRTNYLEDDQIQTVK